MGHGPNNPPNAHGNAAGSGAPRTREGPGGLPGSGKHRAETGRKDAEDRSGETLNPEGNPRGAVSGRVGRWVDALFSLLSL